MKAYKLTDDEGWPQQYSFADGDEQNFEEVLDVVRKTTEQYYYLSNAMDEWRLYQSRGCWCGTWAGLHSVEVSMLEVLVVTGWSQEELEKRGVRKME